MSKTLEQQASIPSRPGAAARGPAAAAQRAKFEIYGEEMIEKQVKQSGNSGRVYLPQEWVGKSVKIIRVY